MACEDGVDELHVDLRHVGFPSRRHRKHVGRERSREKEVDH